MKLRLFLPEITISEARKCSPKFFALCDELGITFETVFWSGEIREIYKIQEITAVIIMPDPPYDRKPLVEYCHSFRHLLVYRDQFVNREGALYNTEILLEETKNRFRKQATLVRISAPGEADGKLIRVETADWHVLCQKALEKKMSVYDFIASFLRPTLAPISVEISLIPRQSVEISIILGQPIVPLVCQCGECEKVFEIGLLTERETPVDALTRFFWRRLDEKGYVCPACVGKLIPRSKGK